MGQAFMQARALVFPGPQWAPETIEYWLDEVDEGAPHAYDHIPESDEKHPEQDARIAECIARGLTRATLVEGVPEEDPFLRQYPEYAANEEYWDALSSLHDEDGNNSDEDTETANEAIAKVAEVSEGLECNGKPESQDANEAFFEIAVATERHTEISRGPFLAVGSFHS